MRLQQEKHQAQICNWSGIEFVTLPWLQNTGCIKEKFVIHQNTPQNDTVRVAQPRYRSLYIINPLVPSSSRNIITAFNILAKQTMEKYIRSLWFS